jgi:hypothetical protein
MTLPVTVTDRFRAAWKAFKQNRKPDPEALNKYLAMREAERQATLNKLDPYDKAVVASIAGGTANAEQLLSQVMPAIERLGVEDQRAIMVHICKGNPYAVLYPATRAWRSKPEVTQEMIRYTTQKDSTVVVVTQ